jgi:pimeloyl-ACP methyl ester carboxylesterase
MIPLIELRHASIHGHDLAYRLVGPDPADAPDDGGTIVLVHGMAGSSRTWRDVMPALGRRHQVLALDLPGHGRSGLSAGDYSLGAMASAVRDLMAQLGIERATMVGQSLGGGVVMQFAYQYPERVDRVVLVSSGGLGREVSWLLRLLSLPGADLVLPVAAPAFVTSRGNTVSRWLADHGVAAPRVAEMWQAYASLADPATRGAFLRTLRSVVTPGGQAVGAADRLYLMAGTPALIIWGTDDDIIPVAHGLAAHDSMPGSRLEIFDGVGHFPQVEAPDRFVEVVDDFVSTTEPAIRASASSAA